MVKPVKFIYMTKRSNTSLLKGKKKSYEKSLQVLEYRYWSWFFLRTISNFFEIRSGMRKLKEFIFLWNKAHKIQSFSKIPRMSRVKQVEKIIQAKYSVLNNFPSMFIMNLWKNKETHLSLRYLVRDLLDSEDVWCMNLATSSVSSSIMLWSVRYFIPWKTE